MRPNWRVLSVYLLGVFLGALDTNVVGPVFPLLMASFHISLAWTAWTVTIYTVAYVAATVLAGALGDRLGHRRVFSWGIVAFGVASIVAATAPNFGVFLVARLIQGSGAGAVYPNAQAEGLRHFPSDKKGLALGVFGAAFGLASILGPTLGGLLGQYVGWPAVFLVNAPLALVVLALLRRAPATETAERAMPDVAGGLAFSGFLAALLLWVMAAGTVRWVCLVAGLVLFGVFVGRQHRAAVPFLDTAPLASPAGAMLVAGAAIVGLDMSSAVFVPTLVQRSLGFDVLASGLALLPAALVGAVLSGVSGVLTDRAGPRLVLIIGLAAGVGGAILLAWPGLTFGRFLAAMALFGLATAFTMGAPLNRIGVALYRDDQAGQALALMAVFRSTGLAAGPVLLTAAQVFRGFTGMFSVVGLASLLGVFLFLGVPDVRPDGRRIASPNP